MAERGMSWIRVDTDFEDHPKVGDLCDRLNNLEAGMFPVRVWAFAGRQFPEDGLLRTSVRRIEEACRWRKKEGVLVEALIACGFLERTKDGFQVHGWDEHNGAIFAKMKNDRRHSSDRRKRATNASPSRESRATPERPSDDSPETVAVHTEQNRTEQKNEETHTRATPSEPPAPESLPVPTPLAMESTTLGSWPKGTQAIYDLWRKHFAGPDTPKFNQRDAFDIEHGLLNARKLFPDRESDEVCLQAIEGHARNPFRKENAGKRPSSLEALLRPENITDGLGWLRKQAPTKSDHSRRRQEAPGINEAFDGLPVGRM